MQFLLWVHFYRVLNLPLSFFRVTKNRPECSNIPKKSLEVVKKASRIMTPTDFKENYTDMITALQTKLMTPLHIYTAELFMENILMI